MVTIKDIKNTFKDKSLLDQALTHKSWLNEHSKQRGSNERLEFLGDAILELVITENLYKAFPDEQEGYLTSLRANLVNTVNLAQLAKKVGIGEMIFLSKGEEDGGGRSNPSLLADTMEAIIGAMYLDQGIEKVREFINENLVTEIPSKIAGPLKDAKSRLQEFVQSKGLPAPRYIVLEESGPDHDKKFVIEVVVNGKSAGKGIGKSKSLAQQKAAEEGLSFLENQGKIATHG